MDFGFSAEEHLRQESAKIPEKNDVPQHKDHSPLVVGDNEKLQKNASGSTDDFEHVDHDPFLPDTYVEASVGQLGIMDDLLSGPKEQIKNSKSDKESEFSHMLSSGKDFTNEKISAIESSMEEKINQTKDFMAAEIGGSSLSKEPPKKTSAADVLIPENMHSLSFNDSPVKKVMKEDNEKFISSEDLLGDFKDEHKQPELISQIQSQPEPPTLISMIPTAPKEEEKKEETKVQPKPKTEIFEEKDRIPPVVEDVSTFVKKTTPPAITTTTTTTNLPTKKPEQMITAEEMFCKFGLDAWFKPERLHPLVESLIYWRDVKKSGIVFGAGLVILLAISCFSVISVFAYLSLLVLAGTVAFRIYKNVLGAVQKTSEGHPFKDYLELDLTISQEKALNVVNVAIAHFNGFITELRRLFLVEDLVDSVKFGVILWVLTYIGAWFNGMTLVILAFVALFTLPKVYENNKQSIDTYLDLVRSKVLEITEKVKAAIPIGKKPETDKDK